MSGISGITGVSGFASMQAMQAMSPMKSIVPAADDSATSGSNAASGFAAAMGNGVAKLQALQSTTDTLAVRAATGDLSDISDYTIAASQLKLATDLTVAVRNKAVDAFTEIMRMTI